MATSLAKQLAQIGSIDASRLDNPTSKARDSFLFTARQAATLSYTDVHSLGYNGFLALAAENERLLRFEGPIFGEKAKVTDRTLLTRDEDKKLDRNIQLLLINLGPKFLVKNAGKVLEWLIRRFRINELNAEDVLRTMLPYHETPQFAQMLHILKLDDPRFVPLQAVRKAFQPLPRAHLTTAMSKSPDLLRFVAGTLKHALTEAEAYPALLNFWTASLTGYLDRSAAVDENSMAVLLPAVVEAVRSRDGDVMLAGLVVLGCMASKVNFGIDTIELFINTILSRRLAEQIPAVIEASFTALIVLTETQQAVDLKFPVKAVLNIAHSDQLQSNFSALARRYNVGWLVKPLMTTLASLVGMNEAAASLAHGMLAPADCPTQITTAALAALISTQLDAGSSSHALLRVLHAVAQREPDLYYTACATAVSNNPSSQRDVETLQSAVARFGITSSGLSGEAAIDIALVSSADEGRAQALKSLLSAPSKAKTTEIPPQLKTLLVERMRDPALAVTDVLFAPQGKAILRSLIKEDPFPIFDASCYMITASTVPRASAIAHARFLLGTFLDTVPVADRKRWCQTTLFRCLWSRLLCTKANRILWKTLIDLVMGNITDFPLLAGIGSIERGETTDAASTFNREVSRLVAEHIYALPLGEQEVTLSHILHSGLRSVEEARPTSTILSLLVLGDLISIGAGPALCSAILRADPTSDQFAQTPEDVSDAAETALLDSIFGKPESRKVLTTLRSRINLKALLNMKPVNGFGWTWMSDQTHLPANLRDQTMIARSLYCFAHSTDCAPGTNKTLLQYLCTQLVKSDFLAFLASIYTDATTEQHLRLAALHETVSYMKMAMHSSNPIRHDYQIVLPSLLVAISDVNRSVREVALKVVAEMQQQMSHDSSSAIYGFDQFYGESQSRGLQYLQSKHLQAYLQVILDNKAVLLLDGSALHQLHSISLSSAAEKKRSTFRRAIAQYLASHLVAWRSAAARTTILSCLRHIKTDESKVALLLPVLHSHLESKAVAEDTPQSVVATYCSELADVVCILPSDAEQVKSVFAQLLKLLTIQSQHDVAISIRNALRISIVTSAFPYVDSEQQIIFLQHLVGTTDADSPEERANAKSCLSMCRIPGDTAALYLDLLREASLLPLDHSKKLRLDHENTKGSGLRSFELFLSSVDPSLIIATASLLASLMEVLALAVDKYSVDSGDAVYLAQLLLNMIYDLVKKSSSVKITADDRFKISPLLNLLRTSTSQQIVNQSLDLLAILVDLAPDEVLRNIMPIFTFMGVNTLHRDDAHSFRVVDRTMEQLLPALLRSKRRRNVTIDAIIDDMEELLQLFVDAANHVPRHRRVHLFVRLVDVLGPRDFLASVCTKLVGKVSSKLLRSQDTTLLSLPLSVLMNYPANDQIKALSSIVLHATHDLVNIGASDDTLSRDSTPSSVGGMRQISTNPIRSLSKRSILATLAFANLCLQEKSLASKLEQSRRRSSADAEELVQELIQHSLALHEIPTGALTISNVSAVLTMANRLVRSASSLLSTAAFKDMVLRSLDSKCIAVKRNAHAMLLERLSSVKKAKRQILRPALVECIADLVLLCTDASKGDDCIYGVRFLRSFSVFVSDHEAPAMTQAVAGLSDLRMNNIPRRTTTYILAFFADIVPKLGARIIPYGRSIANMALHTIDDMLTSAATSSHKLVKNSIATALFAINTLTLAIPATVQLDLPTIVRTLHRRDIVSLASAEGDATLPTVIATVLGSVIKTTPFETMLNTLAAFWEKTDAAQWLDPVALSETVVRLIKSAKAPEVGEKHKVAFSLLLKMLDFRAHAVSSEVAAPVERTAINAYTQLALKLNEATFRPLFLRLHDWAAIESDNRELRYHRYMMLFRVMDRLLSQLKTIVAPYFAHLVESAAQLLQDNSAPPELGRSVLMCLQRSLDTDTIGFWTAPRLSRMISPLIDRLTATQAEDGFPERVLVSLTRKADSEDTVMHAIVRTLLEKTRSNDERSQLACVRALHTLWQSDLQGQLAAYAAESAPFLVELLENGGDVARETKLLLKTMESIENDLQESYTSTEGSDSEMVAQDD